MNSSGSLRILVVNWLDRENPQAGGAEEHLHQIFGRMAERGHDVSALTSGWSGAPSKAVLDGIQVTRSGSRYTFNLTAPAAAKEAFSGRSFDVVIEDLNKVPLFTPTWGIEGRRLLLVHHLFGGTAFQEANPLLATATWLMERPIPRAYRRVPCVAVSESTREDLISRGMAGDQIRVITNGVDLGMGDGAPERFSEPTILFLGRLKRYKRIDLILSALARLRDEGHILRLMIAGRGDDESRLRNLAESLSIADQVQFLGFVSDEEKRRLFRRAWVHVLTSPKEGWGISVLEAAAEGTASVASDSPGLRESVRHGETGLLVPHGNLGALADAIRQLTSTPLRDEMGTRARAHAEAYSWDAVTEEMEGALRQVVSGWSGAWRAT